MKPPRFRLRVPPPSALAGVPGLPPSSSSLRKLAARPRDRLDSRSHDMESARISHQRVVQQAARERSVCCVQFALPDLNRRSSDHHIFHSFNLRFIQSSQHPRCRAHHESSPQPTLGPPTRVPRMDRRVRRGVDKPLSRGVSAQRGSTAGKRRHGSSSRSRRPGAGDITPRVRSAASTGVAPRTPPPANAYGEALSRVFSYYCSFFGGSAREDTKMSACMWGSRFACTCGASA